MRYLTLLIILFLHQLIFAQGPTISSFLPASGPVGTAVTITGNGFSTATSDNIVFFGAVKAIVANASSTTLTVTVPVGATFQPITITVNGLTAFAAQPFIVTLVGGGFAFTTSSFASKIDYTAGSRNGTACIASGDLDGDGNPDLIAVNINLKTVSVFRNVSSTGTIALSSKIDFTTGINPFCVTVGDLDGDGKPDLAVANGGSFNGNDGSNNLSIFRNTSTGAGNISFAPKIDLETGITPFCVVIGDFDGDGKPDMASANSRSNTVSIFKNNSTIGSLSFSLKADFVTGVSPFWLAIADLDNDGKVELAVANGDRSNSVSVLRNTSTAGNISFATKIDFDGGIESYGIASGDIDGDGKLDLTIANNTYPSVAILLNNSNGTGNISFRQKSTYQTGAASYGATVSDMDGDGKPDIVIVNSMSNTVSVLKNRSVPGSLTLDPKVDFLVGTYPWVSAVVDLDGDNKPDIATANSASANISILKNVVAAWGIQSFTPTSAGSGTTVTVNGLNFTGITGVSFGGIPAASYNVVSSTTISAVIGVGASGNVTITTNSDTATVAGFTYLPAPATTSIILCPPSANTMITSGITGTNYQWQVDTSNGFINIIDNSNYGGSNTNVLQLISIPSAWYGYKYRCISDIITSVIFELKFANLWTGSASSSWENAVNWTCGVIPDYNTDVVINSGTIVINSNVTIRSLTVNPGVTVTVNPGFNLKILH